MGFAASQFYADTAGAKRLTIYARLDLSGFDKLSQNLTKTEDFDGSQWGIPIEN